MKGVLVAFEGIDGSGLSTHVALVSKRLADQGFMVMIGKEPTMGPIGKLIRELLREEEVDQDIMALLFAADRLWHLRRGAGHLPILEALNRGFVVILDRYKHSSIAYQSLKAEESWVEVLNSLAPDPHIVVFIDVPVAVALDRVSRRRERFYYEEARRLTAIKENFYRVLRRAEERGTRVIRVAGVDEGGKERSIEEVQEEIYVRLRAELSRLLR
ncbi:MAG: dTMP kinase [Acidilobaceae archaeon]|nr:dTMP kinase [Acidilobaceae archaeon]MCX8166077.1 dTMP kinase [Acidilobaceae archaeon]MDW7974720.1 dTMP kinase [Sulfolobales archaeon]